MEAPGTKRSRWLKPVVFACCSIPLAKVGTDAFRGGLSANPVVEVLNRFGFWALFFLVLSLTPTPLNRWARLQWPLRVRRMLGLFALFYACTHFTIYVLDQGFEWSEIAKDIAKRPFITIGFLTLLTLIPLGITSTQGWVRRLGFKRWKRLHRLAYVAAVLGTIHFVWRVKADLTVPRYFIFTLVALFALRLIKR